jgi:hypothetical protein
MATHLDGDTLAGLPEETQQELKAWARSNWKPGAPSGYWGIDGFPEGLPVLSEDMKAEHRGYSGALYHVERMRLREQLGPDEHDVGPWGPWVRYWFWSGELDGPFLFDQPETVPLPEHLAEHFTESDS